MQKITFGDRGKEPGQFDLNLGMAVSADNEIFIADVSNKRVQVSSINGTYLRLFPTDVPGEHRKISPHTVAIGVEPDKLWVAGKNKWVRGSVPTGQVVQYNMKGLPLKTFDIHVDLFTFPAIAIDVCNNKVILGDVDTIRIYQPNGSLVEGFQVHVPKDMQAIPIHGVASDSKGNVVLVDWRGHVQVYNHFGDMILEFVGTPDNVFPPRGIFVDSSGRIILSNCSKNRVDMFTSQGDFVRTVVNTTNPSYIAIGPDGQLVVANTVGTTVTIFPRHVLFP
eukprot:XP_002588256.1 hypothetical protein BRAFLDRAFT_86704 [Branchiostoma floridae]